jgi:MORN repeat
MDKRHGQGTEYNSNGTIWYEGEWIQGAPTLREVRDQALYDYNGVNGRYTGTVLPSTGMPHGVGHILYVDGDTFEGEWYVVSKSVSCV